MVDRFTITAAEQDPWIDADANGQWVRYADYAALEAKLAEARQVVALFEDYGCPICHGDCASANPPVYCCPMEAARRIRERGAHG